MLQAKAMVSERKSARDRSARELLVFYLEAGVDTPVAETPANRFADETNVASITTSSPDAPRALPRSTAAGLGNRQRVEGPQVTPPPPAAPPSPEAAIMEAREAARTASS